MKKTKSILSKREIDNSILLSVFERIRIIPLPLSDIDEKNKLIIAETLSLLPKKNT